METRDLDARVADLLAAAKTDRAKIVEAFFEVQDELEGAVRAIVARAGLGDRTDDVCQEVWDAVWNGLEGFRGDAKLLTWIEQIARNKINSERRRDYRRAEVAPLLANPAPLDQLLSGAAASGSASPEERVQRAMVARAVQAAVEKLGEADRVLYEWHYGELLKPSSLIKTKGLKAKPRAVSDRLYRLRTRLEKLLREDKVIQSALSLKAG